MGLRLPERGSERLHSFLTRKLGAPPATATRSFRTRGQDAVMTVGSRRPGPAVIHPNAASALGTSAPQTSCPVARKQKRGPAHFCPRIWSRCGCLVNARSGAELSCKGVWEEHFILHLWQAASGGNAQASGYWPWLSFSLSSGFVINFIFTPAPPPPSSPPALEVPLGSRLPLLVGFLTRVTVFRSPIPSYHATC